jgi:hypothetical protein
LKSEIPVFLDRWILNLRLGSAPRSARDRALREHSEGFQMLMRPVFDTQNTSPLPRGHLIAPKIMLQELDSIQREPHVALLRLENLRSLLRKTADFRRKSGQALLQTTIQSSVMMALLIALVLFTLHRYGWRKSGDLIMGSIMLSLIGVVMMYFLARKTKWKI